MYNTQGDCGLFKTFVKPTSSRSCIHLRIVYMYAQNHAYIYKQSLLTYTFLICSYHLGHIYPMFHINYSCFIVQCHSARSHPKTTNITYFPQIKEFFVHFISLNMDMFPPSNRVVTNLNIPAPLAFTTSFTKAISCCAGDLLPEVHIQETVHNWIDGVIEKIGFQTKFID